MREKLTYWPKSREKIKYNKTLIQLDYIQTPFKSESFQVQYIYTFYNRAKHHVLIQSWISPSVVLQIIFFRSLTKGFAKTSIVFSIVVIIFFVSALLFSSWEHVSQIETAYILYTLFIYMYAAQTSCRCYFRTEARGYLNCLIATPSSRFWRSKIKHFLTKQKKKKIFVLLKFCQTVNFIIALQFEWNFSAFFLFNNSA